jgi:outer membrane protein TolC
MENALSRYAHETRRHDDLDLAAQQNRRAVTLANQQYKAGYSGLLDLLVAQHDALEAESSLAASNAQLRESLVTIYAAAGGGWAL